MQTKNNKLLIVGVPNAVIWVIRAVYVASESFP